MSKVPESNGEAAVCCLVVIVATPVILAWEFVFPVIGLLYVFGWLK